MNVPDSDSVPEPVVLYGWPSCRNSLSWSADGEIAVAAGDYVHILTPKQLSKADLSSDLGTIGLRQWHSARVRTGLFTQQEWPDQEPDSSGGFSLGEEQSSSTVVGMAWSPPGIGPHRRSVLAVLTSNLVLSLWESNGTIGDWRRVIVVNHALGNYFDGLNEDGQDINRGRRRIRAFAWAPPFQCLEAEDGQVLTSKWGVFYIAVANDARTVTILKYSKLRKGPGKLEAFYHVDMPRPNAYDNAPRTFSMFQKAMATKIPILSLSWSVLNADLSKTLITVGQSNGEEMIKVKAMATVIEDKSAGSLDPNIHLSAGLCYDQEERNTSQSPEEIIADRAELKKKIEELRLDFDSYHCLDGNSSACIWGFDSNETHDVVCVTTHPSDMVEYKTVSLETCTLLFVRSARSALRYHLSSETTTSDQTVRLRVMSFILRASQKLLPASAVDRTLLSIAASLGLHADDEKVRREASIALNRLYETMESWSRQNGMDMTEPEKSLACLEMERCFICKALIPLNESEQTAARCETGHPYTRCNLSLLTIQEPGISKYCSRCDRQYLNSEIVEADPAVELHGPSLMDLLFEAFDLCPYCEAKFYG